MKLYTQNFETAEELVDFINNNKISKAQILSINVIGVSDFTLFYFNN